MKSGRVLSWKKDHNKVHIACENFNVEVEAFTEKIINIYAHQSRKKTFSQAVIIRPRYIAFQVEEQEDYLILATECLTVRVNKRDFTLEFSDGRGFLLEGQDLILGEKWRGCSFSIRPDEHFYGLGEKTGFLDKRGKRYTMWNVDCYETYTEGADAMYQSYPFYIGTNKSGSYGVYFDNTFRTIFDMGKSNADKVTFGSEKGPLNFFFIYGPTVKEVVEGYTEITGRIELPPVWALGYQQSRYSYYPQERVLEIAKEFRQRDIPCDVLYLDIDYMDGFRVFTFDKERFPDPPGLIRELKEMGFKVVAIVDPGVKVDINYRVYKEGLEKGYFVTDENGLIFTGKVWPGLTCFPDFSRDDVKTWWADLHKEFLEMGIAGIWNDMNEPTVLDDPAKMMPLNLIHQGNGNPVTHEEFRNLYALNMAMATREGLLKFKPGERPFILTRAAFAGIQRYAAIWTGDNRSYWDHLKMSIPMLLNLGLSGEPFCGADIGGFAGDASEELLIRWTQVGAFYPFCRNHTEVNTVSQEPWAFGRRCEDICRKFIQLRYTLLPYIYNLFYQASQSGAPVLRPLVWEYERDENCHRIFDQFLLGDSILVAPVYEPGQIKRAVYLPEGKWLDWWSGEVLEGSQYHLVDAPLEKIPLFVKEGAIIPMARPVNYVGEGPWQVEFHLFLGSSKGEYIYYEDDGQSHDYQKGVFNLYRISYTTLNNGVLTLRWEKLHSGFAKGQKQFKAVLRNTGQIKEVWVNGNRVEFKLEGGEKTIQLQDNWRNQEG